MMRDWIGSVTIRPERQSKVTIDTVYHLKSHNAFYCRNVMRFCETEGSSEFIQRKLVEELSLSSSQIMKLFCCGEVPSYMFLDDNIKTR